MFLGELRRHCELDESNDDSGLTRKERNAASDREFKISDKRERVEKRKQRLLDEMGVLAEEMEGEREKANLAKQVVDAAWERGRGVGGDGVDGGE